MSCFQRADEQAVLAKSAGLHCKTALLSTAPNGCPIGAPVFLLRVTGVESCLPEKANRRLRNDDILPRFRLSATAPLVRSRGGGQSRRVRPPVFAFPQPRRLSEAVAAVNPDASDRPFLRRRDAFARKQEKNRVKFPKRCCNMPFCVV